MTSKLLLSIRLSYMSSNLTRQNDLSSREISEETNHSFQDVDGGTCYDLQ